MIRIVLALITALCALPAQAETRVPTSPAEISLSFVPLVKEAAPAVVNIYAKVITETQRTPFSNDPFFFDFFRDRREPRPRVQNSLGSGVILSEDGIVVSNYHVVGMATDIRVVLQDRREFSARVLLGDKNSDLAILQLDDARDLPSLPLRQSDEVEVGELVLAIGNPFGVGQTVSSGIVSGLARSGGMRGAGRGYFIQTDAPINPGNSGGALIDVAGRLIGINTQIVTRSGGSNGIGFAIPADLVAAFKAQAEAGRETFERPWAGLSGQPVDQGLAESLGLEAPEGIVISDIHPESPFAAADFKVGDVITGVDGGTVHTPSEMVYRMSVAGQGTVMIDRVRNATRDAVPVELMAAPEVPARELRKLASRTGLLGVSVVNINPAVIAEFGLPLNVRGVVVSEVDKSGVIAGLQAGDVILEIGNTPITKTSDISRRLVLRSGSRLKLQRGNRRFIVSIRR